MQERTFTTDNNLFIDIIFGDLGNIESKIRKEYDVQLKLNASDIQIIGEEPNVSLSHHLLEDIHHLVEQGRIDASDIDYVIQLNRETRDSCLEDLKNTVVIVNHKGKPIKPKTLGQKEYVDIIKKNDIVFGIGPAGTGKTYLAMAMAIRAFKNHEVDRIILTRPAVEAGESLGFLPGDLQEKIDPYLRPIYDALFDILGFESYSKLQERGLIEVAPLAYMRGRTLDSAYVILDEAQNTTNQQMKMFLTRIGFGSKAIITGDVTQVDLPHGKKSGLIMAEKILQDVEGIAFAKLKKRDIVRHPLVQKIINAYEKRELKNGLGNK